MKAALVSLGSESSQWTLKAMKAYFDEVDDLDLREIEVNLGTQGAEVLHKGDPIKEYDCIYAKGSFRFAALLNALTCCLRRKVYMPLQQQSFMLGHDKMLTHLALQEHNIPMPKTYISSTDASKVVLEKISYPIVMKFPHGTQGKGVMFADSYSSASSMLDALSSLKQTFLMQEYVECDETDIRALVIGGKVVASMKRKAVKGEKRANIHAGAVAEPYELDNYGKKIAIQTAQAVGADVCGVDMLESSRGPLVIEVNLSPGLQGITKTTGVDVADEIAKFLYDKTKEFKSLEHDEKAKGILGELGINGVGEEK
jgi:ribosomal protein S6--L-glutamate ligase